ncbi:MAG: tyrosine-type recombinase/integrase [Lachnospiraceae bacterium]|nr:tyrosine-type recombinase/integrase [Lachnospiraceae bacterium]
MMERRMTDGMLNAFETMLKEDEKSKHTVEKYVRDVRCFWCFAEERGIDKVLTIEYKAFLEKEYATASANSMIAALNSFLRFAGWEDCCIKQFKVQKKAYCSENEELTKAEYLSLVRTADDKRNERLSLLIQTICGTGIRVSEVSFITVEAARQGEATVYCKGKRRTVFIVSALRKKLLRYAKEHDIRSGMIFVTKSGKAMNRSNIWREMKELCKQSGVSPNKVFPHNLRHLFARTFYGIEKDIAKLADILGHSNINTTRIYIISTGAEHKHRMESMRLIL